MSSSDISPGESHHPPRRKLRILVISMGSIRQEYINAMFSSHPMQLHFDPPTFSPGVPSRDLRNKYLFFNHAGEAGILPLEEWEAIRTIGKRLHEQGNINWLGECLKNVPCSTPRRGVDQNLHYSIELWKKAKAINRGRSVLACLFAHLKAMRKLVDDNFDLILEDNVRAPLWLYPNRNYGHEENGTESELASQNDEKLLNRFMNVSMEDSIACECAERIWETLDASAEWAESYGRPCHLRYYGWLGSRANLEFILLRHISKTRFRRRIHDSPANVSIFPFPVTSDFYSDEETEKEQDRSSSSTVHTSPGGTPIWGAYAYWISKQGFEAMIQGIQADVGALLWKGKRMKFYVVKPIDKVMPRRVMAAFPQCDHDAIQNGATIDFARDKNVIEWGRECIHVTTHPAFFRAPMLASNIHRQFDPEFCKSTEFQMSLCQRSSTPMNTKEIDCWDQLWLPQTERDVVECRRKSGMWLNVRDHEGKNKCHMQEPE